MKPFILTASTLAGTWLTFASLATAQAPTSLALESPHTLRGQAPVTGIPSSADHHARLYWDADEDGTVWVRGRNFKASFGMSGATYYPLFGSEQPRHFPVALSLSSATTGGQAIALEPVTGAVRDGERVIIDRGPIDEIYEVGVEGIEQTFVVDGRPQGDLKLVAGVVTELAPGEHADGLEFANEYGGVRYSRAFVRESAQVKRPLDTRLVEGGVAIELDAQYLSTAQFPLVVDPLITTFGVAVMSPLNDFHSSVAYDVTTDHYLFVYEEGTSAFDGDVYAKLTDSTGAVLSEGYVDMTTEDWYEPQVANLNAYDQFLVAGRVIILAPAGSEVRGRLTNASSLSLGAKFTIASGSSAGIAPRIAVGGDPYGSAPSYYCVCWCEAVGGNWDVRARLVTNLGTLFGAGPLILANTGVDEVEVAVSRSNGGTRWNVAWERTFDLRGAQIEWNGAITTPSFSISSSSSDSRPAPSSPLPNGDYVVTFERDFGSLLGYHDIMVVLVSGSSVSPLTSIQGLEAAGDQAWDQRNPAIDCDGHQFAVTYERTVDSTHLHPQTLLTSFYVLDGAFGLSEGHIFVPWPSSDVSQANVYAQHSAGGSSRRYALSLSTVSNPSGPNLADVFGAFYDGVQGGPISTACYGNGSGTACPCGNNGSGQRGCGHSSNSSGAFVGSTGHADLANDTVQMGAWDVPAGAPCLFFQGTNLYAGGNGVAFGDGLLCAGGSITRIAVKFAIGTAVYYPSDVSDPDLSIAGAVPAAGAVRYYQVWYRDSAMFCSSLTYNLTSALKVVWLP